MFNNKKGNTYFLFSYTSQTRCGCLDFDSSIIPQYVKFKYKTKQNTTHRQLILEEQLGFFSSSVLSFYYLFSSFFLKNGQKRYCRNITIDYDVCLSVCLSITFESVHSVVSSFLFESHFLLPFFFLVFLFC